MPKERKNKMKKTFSLLLAAALLLLSLTGCAQKQDTVVTKPADTTEKGDDVKTPDPVDVRIAALKGPTAMGMVKFMSDNDDKLITDNNYSFEIAASADLVTPGLIQGTIDIAAVPANLASVLYNNTDGEIEVLAVNTLGVLYIVENGTGVNSVADLKGKTIYASGKGSTPEYALNYILKENGIDPEKDVTVEWLSEHTACLNMLLSQEGSVAMLPQPFVTVAQSKSDIRVALDLTDEWNAVQKDGTTASTMITGVVVVRKQFAKDNPDAVNAFLDHYKESVEYVKANNDEAAALVGKYDIVTEEVAKKALPECNITFVEGDEMKTMLSGYLAVLYAQNPTAVGGKLPNDDFYYKR